MVKLANQAITVAINPETFVNLSNVFSGNRRAKWKNLTNEDQTNYLDHTILGRMDVNKLKYIYGYEKTVAGNVHVHIEVEVSDDSDIGCLNEIRSAFISLLPRMPAYLQSRVWYQKDVYDMPGWINYVLKESSRQLKDFQGKSFNCDNVPDIIKASSTHTDVPETEGEQDPGSPPSPPLSPRIINYKSKIF